MKMFEHFSFDHVALLIVPSKHVHLNKVPIAYSPQRLFTLSGLECKTLQPRGLGSNPAIVKFFSAKFFSAKI